MQDGLCRREDPNLFFPEGRGAPLAIQTEQAKTVCNGCPVRAVCLEWAVETGQPTGVWGGLSVDERRDLMRERAELRQSSYARCIDAQEYIEQRIADGASHREIGDELGVGHSSVGKAWRFFQSEKVQAQDTVLDGVKAA
jgi:hypothetical protein